MLRVQLLRTTLQVGRVIKLTYGVLWFGAMFTGTIQNRSPTHSRNVYEEQRKVGLGISSTAWVFAEPLWWRHINWYPYFTAAQLSCAVHHWHIS